MAQHPKEPNRKHPVAPNAIVFDCEFLVAEGAQQRFWCGPRDPDPVIAQIGAVRLALDAEFAIDDSLSVLVEPRDRTGARFPIDPFFTDLTGITEAEIRSGGVSLAVALNTVKRFAGGARLWSWGKDEFNMIAISCYVEGLPPPIPATQFGNATTLLLAAGMPYETLVRTRSHQLADLFGVPRPPSRAHDALGDAMSVAVVLQHLLRDGRLGPEDLA